MHKYCFFFKSLRTIEIEHAKLVNLKPGQKVCPSCDQKLRFGEQSASSTDEEFEPLTTVTSALNSTATMFGCSPVKVATISSRDKMAYGKRKLHEITKFTQQKVAKVLQIPESSLNCSTKKFSISECKDCDKFIELLKQKCSVASRQEQVKLLTLVPESWSIKKAVTEFEVSTHLMRKARELKKESGILANPKTKQGKPLSLETINKVVEFYQSDDYSRMCPGKKEFVSIKSGSEKIQKQKRLLLVNLKELYEQFQQNNSYAIGFSKFCELRPKWCVTVNSKGMHSVCVCKKHQHAKLLCSGLPEKVSYLDILMHMVCSLENRNCMMQKCLQCPGKDQLTDVLKQTFEQNDVDQEDIITVKQ